MKELKCALEVKYNSIEVWKFLSLVIIGRFEQRECEEVVEK